MPFGAFPHGLPPVPGLQVGKMSLPTLPLGVRGQANLCASPSSPSSRPRPGPLQRTLPCFSWLRLVLLGGQLPAAHWQVGRSLELLRREPKIERDRQALGETRALAHTLPSTFSSLPNPSRASHHPSVPGRGTRTGRWHPALPHHDQPKLRGSQLFELGQGGGGGEGA